MFLFSLKLSIEFGLRTDRERLLPQTGYRFRRGSPRAPSAVRPVTLPVVPNKRLVYPRLVATEPASGDAHALVRLEHRGSVAIVQLDRPKANTLSIQLLDELLAICQDLIEQPPGAVVVWGGERIFAAGADVRELADPASASLLVASFQRALEALAVIPRATIAAIAGFALGGGLELALACDLRVAGPSARLGMPEVHLGLIPGAGGTQRLTRLIGPARTKDLVMTGRQIDVEEAFRIGLVDRVAPSDVLAAALELASELAAGPVIAHGLAKEAVDRGAELSLAEGLALERSLFERALASEDGRIGMESFLRDGPGRARFTGR
jgi:enoyl-CoA hydratase/carnithine racemase